jgi:hypothetical protein
MPMCINWFAFAAPPPSSAVVKETICRFYPVEIDGVEAKALPDGRMIMSVVFWAGTNLALTYVRSAMDSLGGQRVDHEGEPLSRTVPEFARRPWAEHPFVDRLRLRTRDMFGLRFTDT